MEKKKKKKKQKKKTTFYLDLCIVIIALLFQTQEEAQVLKPLTLEDEHDSELAKAIEMSLKEQEEREQVSSAW